jgi:DNA helicase HerA-like ATPase
MDLSTIRVREHFGLIANDSHIEKFSFLVSPPKGRSGLQKNDYILVDHPLIGETCQVMAIITDIASYEEIAGSTINEKKAKMLAIAQVLGYVDITKEDKPLKELLVPPNPGSRVYIPQKGFLQDLLNKDLKGKTFTEPIEIGTFEGLSSDQLTNNEPVKAFLEVKEFITKPSLITGATKSGKTLIAQKLLTKIIEKKSSNVVIFDQYEEYGKLANQEYSLTSKFNDQDFISAVKKNPVLRITSKQLATNQKNGIYSEALLALVKSNLNEPQPTVLVVDNPETLQRPILEEAINTGERMGLAICLITSHPSELGGNILSKISTLIMGKSFDNQDIEFLKNAVGTFNLSKLLINEWIINGINMRRPMKIVAE